MPFPFKFRYFILIFSGLGSLWSCAPTQNPVRPNNLRVEHLINPIHLDLPKPRLSWQLITEDPAIRNIRQTGYHILVSSSKHQLQRNMGDVWDSGKVASDQSVLVAYGGPPLKSRETYFWKVKLWDQDGQATDWSEINTWRIGLLQAEDWSGAQWIGYNNDQRDTLFAQRNFKTSGMDSSIARISHPSPLFRRVMKLEKKVYSAFAYISGLGYSELYINGQKISDQVLDPGQTSYNKGALYVTHDITPYLQSGPNVFGIWLGNGFYGQNIAFASHLEYGQPRVLAKFFITYQDGSLDTILTNTDWKATNSPIIFDNVYGGETYDARREIAGWNEPGFEDSHWPPAIRLLPPGPNTELRSQLMPPIRITKRLPPQSISRLKNGDYLIDFGQNMAGWVKIKVREQEGKVITIQTAEAIRADKQGINDQSIGHFATGLKQELVYICKGGGEETWEPRFTYHGFQYAQINGLSQAPRAETIEGVLVHTDVERRGNFACSDEQLNRIYQTSLWTIVDNLHSLPENGQHREKCGWLLDAHSVSETCLYNFDMSLFYHKYLQDIHDNLIRDKRINEQFPHLDGVPTRVAPGKRLAGTATLDWGVALILIPWYLYQHTGDLDVFRQHYPHMIEFIEYMYSFQADDGTIKNDLGDRRPPGSDPKTAQENLVYYSSISANAYFYQALQIMAGMAKKLGDSKYAWWAEGQAEQLKQAFNRVFLQPIPNTDLRYYGSQTATVMALKFDIVPDSLKEEVIQALLFDIEELHNGHHSCGIQGLRYLYTVLAENGQEDLAYRMLTDPTFPSPTYIVNAGLTTWPERQWEWDKLPEWERSLNHPMQGGFTAFLHESIAGIQPDTGRAGYQQIILQPYLTDQLEWVEASHDSPYGHIVSAWRNTAAGFEWTVEIPHNTTAIIRFPMGEAKQVLESGQFYNFKYKQIKNGKKIWSEYKIGSGKYKFNI